MDMPVSLDTPGTEVWSIPHLAANILSYLPTGDIITLLRVSKLHFKASVIPLYTQIPWDTYTRSIAPLAGSERYTEYVNAILAVHHLGDGGPDISSWIECLDRLPKAARLMAQTETYCREFRNGHPIYTYNACFDFLTSTGDVGPLLYRPAEVPDSWNVCWVLRMVDDDLFFEKLDETARNEALRDNIVETSELPDVKLSGVFLTSPWPSQAIFDPLQHLLTRGQTIPSQLACHHMDSEFFTRLLPVAAHLTHLQLSNSFADLTIGRILREFEPSRFTKLSDLEIGYDAFDLDTQNPLPMPTRSDAWQVSRVSQKLVGLSSCKILVSSTQWATMSLDQFCVVIESVRLAARHLYPLLRNPRVIRVHGVTQDPYGYDASSYISATLQNTFTDEIALIEAIAD